MNLLFIGSWFSAPVAKAIGWTLVHSIWQGLLLTFIAGILILFTRKTTAALRYKLLSFLLIAFIITSGITFILELQSAIQANELIAKAGATFVNTTISPSLPAGLPAPVLVNESTSAFSLFELNVFTGYVNRYAPLIVAIWFFIFLFKCLRLAVHIGYAQRLRNHKTSPLPVLQQRLDELATLIKTKATIVRESAIIKAPSVIGFIKPVILLPIGLINNLPADQVEAILLHELAHIRRKDYLVNILQCLAETVFFFNPSVLWLSSLIRQERENCCDDMAIAIIGTKTTYISALVAFQEYSSDSPYAPAFPGEKYPVLQRVKRIVYNNNKNLNNMEKIFLTVGLVLSTVLAFTFSSSSAQQPAKPQERVAERRAPEGTAVEPPKNFTADNRMPGDTVPKKLTGTMMRTEDGKSYTLIVKENVVQGLFIDNEKIPDDQLVNHKPLTDRLIADWGKKQERNEQHREEMAEKRAKETERRAEKQARKEKEFEYKAKDKEFKVKGDKDFEYDKEKEFKLKGEKDKEFKLKDKEFRLKEKEEFKLKSDKDFDKKKEKNKEVEKKMKLKEKIIEDKQRELEMKREMDEDRREAKEEKIREKQNKEAEKRSEEEKKRNKETDKRNKEAEKRREESREQQERTTERRKEKSEDAQEKQKEKRKDRKNDKRSEDRKQKDDETIQLVDKKANTDLILQHGNNSIELEGGENPTISLGQDKGRADEPRASKEPTHPRKAKLFKKRSVSLSYEII